MARITALPLAAAPTGAETLPVVQDGFTRRMPLAAFLSQTIAAVVQAANNAANSAAQQAADALLNRQRSALAVPFSLRDGLIAASGVAAGDRASVVADNGVHAAMAGEVRLDGTAAAVGELIPNNGRYTFQDSPAAWLRTGSLDSQNVTETLGVFVKKTGGVEQGGYIADVALPKSLKLLDIFAQVVTGTGSASISIVENDEVVFGPITVTSAPLVQALTVVLTAGANIFVQIEDVTGSVNEIAVRLAGRPA